MSARNATFEERFWRVLLRVVCCLGFLFLLGPIVVILPISFSEGSFLNYPLPGLSLRWYEAIFVPYPWMLALQNSVVIAVATTVLATSLGTMAAYGLSSADFPFKGLVTGLLMAPLVVPLVITALAVYFFFARVGILGTYTGLILAHTVLAVPFVVVTVSATLQGFDRNLARAAASLGARPLDGFLSVTLPLISPGVISGAIFAFVISFDEVVVALIIASPQTFTLPKQLFTWLRDQLNPSIVAIAVLLIVVSVVLMAAVELLRWRSRRLLGAARSEE